MTKDPKTGLITLGKKSPSGLLQPLKSSKSTKPYSYTKVTNILKTKPKKSGRNLAQSARLKRTKLRPLGAK